MRQTLDDRIVHENLEDDRRGTLRMPQPGGGGHGQLRIGSKTVVVEILDESAGGFMVAADKLPKTPPTQPIDLINISGRHPMRVVWRRNVDGQVRLGLQRLPENLQWRSDNTWFVWLLLAMIVGFSIGYVVAFRDQHDLARRIAELSSQKILLNENFDASGSNVEAPVE